MYVFHIIITVSLLMSLEIIAWNIGGPPKKVRVLGFDGYCKNQNQVTIVSNFTDFVVDSENRVSFNGRVLLKEDIKTETSFKMQFMNCKNKDDRSTCIGIPPITSRKFCDLLKSNSIFGKTIFSAFKPKFRCPVRKGFYRVEHGMVDTSTILLLPCDNCTWLSTVELFDTETARKLMCVEMTFTVD